MRIAQFINGKNPEKHDFITTETLYQRELLNAILMTIDILERIIYAFFVFKRLNISSTTIIRGTPTATTRLIGSFK